MATILIVEDDEQNYDLMANVLRKLGHAILYAGNGDEAIGLVQQHHPQLILLDLRLPGLNGWEIASMVKADPATSAIPIIAVSVQVDSTDVERALQAGCDDYIAKPYSIDYLRAAVTHYLSE